MKNGSSANSTTFPPKPIKINPAKGFEGKLIEVSV